jgi:hypothetical protein
LSIFSDETVSRLRPTVSRANSDSSCPRMHPAFLLRWEWEEEGKPYRKNQSDNESIP